MVDRTDKFLNSIAQTIFDKNGANIFALDMRGVTDLADFIIIAEGNVDRHVKAIAKNVIEAAERLGEKPFIVEGEKNGDWIVIDFIGVIVHLFIPEVRQRYALERLWCDGKIVDLEITLPMRRSEDE
ncbi:MAG: ribosome silencing factor [Chlamydiota bacterium]